MSRSIEAHVRALRDLLRAHRPDDAARTLPLSRAGGRVLARDVVAPLDLPPETNSQMDGFAVRAADLAPAAADGAVVLPVADTRAAGSAPSRHEPGTATAVMTGAALPAGADTVVPVERVLPDRFDTPEITVTAETARAHPAGAYVREAGSDVARGAVALRAGTVLGPAAVGACAALGLPPEHEVAVRRGPRVLVVGGGDEVLPAGRALRPGTVHDANGPLLRAWLTDAGAERVTHLGVDDDPRAFVRRLGEAVARERPELVLTSGGISAGAFEVVRQGLGDVGSGMWFGHVAMQPGGPQGCGTIQGVPVVCLPGNPVSTWVSCEVLVRPALAAVWGCCAPPRPVTAALARSTTPLTDRTQLRRGTMTGTGAPAPEVTLVGGTSSHLLTAAAGADVLVVLPPGERPVAAGTPVTVLPVAGGVLTDPGPRTGQTRQTTQTRQGEPR